MQKILENIKNRKLISKGDIVGIACSGGKDSMALLHFMNSIKEKLDFEIVCVNIDHSIREESASDSNFVADYCKANKIRCHKFAIDCLYLARTRNIGLEEAARDGRYDMFRALIKKGIVDKIALAHQELDQAETILMHIFRGAGLKGASGMDYSSEGGTFIRPMLNVSLKEILEYLNLNNIEWVEDKSNKDNQYSRNYLRNEIIPKILIGWQNAVENIANFGQICKTDDDYINSMIDLDAIIYDSKKNMVQLPKSYFLFKESIVNRMIRNALTMLNANYNFETKHIEMIKQLSNNKENGAKISLPNKVIAYVEFDYISLIYKKSIIKKDIWRLTLGKKKLLGVGTLIVKKTTDYSIQSDILKIDADKLPKGIVWRYKQDGDYMVKFGGGTKKLKKLFAEKKIPLRLRDHYPVLACDNEVLVISGVEISEKIKLDENTLNAISIQLLLE